MRWMLIVGSLFAALFVTACGDESKPLEPVSWPFLEKPETVKINGKDFKAFVASDEARRVRAQNGLTTRKDEVIAYLYPSSIDTVELDFSSLPVDTDLVFIDGDSKVQQVNTIHAYSNNPFRQKFAVEGARVVLQLPAGTAKDLKLTSGAKLSTAPDLVKKSKDAGDEFARLYFLKSPKPEDKPEDTPFVELKVLNTAEEIAQGMKDRNGFKEGQGIMVAVDAKHSFWLKEVTDTCCACYLVRSSSSRSTSVGVKFTNITGKNQGDENEPVYYAPKNAAYLAIWKGKDTFKKHDITDYARVNITGVSDGSSEDPDLQNVEVKFGESVLTCRLARTDETRTNAVLSGRDLDPERGYVLAWDTINEVDLSGFAPGTSVWTINRDKGKYSIGEKFKTGAGPQGKATSKFALVVPEGYKADGELDFPYVLRDLQPRLPVVHFYHAKKSDIVENRWPTKDNNLKASARVEMALTYAEQAKGLMYRKSLKPNHGMIFIYKEEQEMSYWMKNCKMDLSIAFIDRNGVIVKIHKRMKAPEKGTPDAALERYESGEPTQYAIEMEAEWFEKNGVKEGDRVFIPSNIIPE